MKLIKESILNKIQVAAEVNGALLEHNLVIVTKTSKSEADPLSSRPIPVYAVYACRGELIDGQLHEFGDHDRDTREKEGQQ